MSEILILNFKHRIVLVLLRKPSCRQILGGRAQHFIPSSEVVYFEGGKNMDFHTFIDLLDGQKKIKSFLFKQSHRRLDVHVNE